MMIPQKHTVMVTVILSDHHRHVWQYLRYSQNFNELQITQNHSALVKVVKSFLWMTDVITTWMRSDVNGEMKHRLLKLICLDWQSLMCQYQDHFQTVWHVINYRPRCYVMIWRVSLTCWVCLRLWWWWGGGWVWWWSLFMQILFTHEQSREAISIRDEAFRSSVDL